MKFELSRIDMKSSCANSGRASYLLGAVTAQDRSAAFTPLPRDSFPAALRNFPNAAAMPPSKRPEGRAPAPITRGAPYTDQASRISTERAALPFEGRGHHSLLRLGHRTESRGAHRRRAAFTMVEIALCLGVIAFALVAIIGVLPTGIRVQKDNREDTVINQEGLLWVEAIRSGSRGLDYLTNYVDAITVSNALGATTFYNPAGL